MNAYFIHSHAPNTTSLPPPSLLSKTRFPHKLQMNIFHAYQQAHVHRGTATPGPPSVQFNVTMFIFVKNMFSLFTDLNGSHIVPFTPTTHAPPAPPPPTRTCVMHIRTCMLRCSGDPSAAINASTMAVWPAHEACIRAVSPLLAFESLNRLGWDAGGGVREER